MVIGKIVLASSNPHKIVEINAITKNLGLEFIMPPAGFDPVEDGETFEENACIKAREASKLTGLPALADDSGLCVEYLNDGPGIYSARYANTPESRIEKLLNELRDVPLEKRGAKFVCAMVLVDANGKIIFSDRGECFGKIAFEKSGVNGFGYDPVFIVNGHGVSMATMSEEDKNKISHRAVALSKFLEFITNYK